MVHLTGQGESAKRPNNNDELCKKVREVNIKPLEMGIRPEMRKAQKPNTRGSASAGVPPRVGDLTRGQRGRAQHALLCAA